jgi:uncharacterized membrane protein
MLISVAASFFINEGRQLGPFSATHVLSASMLIGLPVAVQAARKASPVRSGSTRCGAWGLCEG